MRRSAAASALVVLGLVAGCSSPDRVPGTTVTASENPNDQALVSQREAAGLPDCSPPATASAAVPGGLPDLVLPCLGSTRSVNLAHLRGRPLVVNIWAQWCGPCRTEAPALREFAERAGDRVRILGIDFDDPAPADAVEFAGLVRWRYEHLVDRKALLRSRLQLPGIPVTLFVAADGRIVHRRTGPAASADELAALVQQHLGVTV